MNPHADQPVLTAGAPITGATGVVIMVHGRGAGPENILDLVPAVSYTHLTLPTILRV